MTTATQSNLFTRDDTFFGVCEAIGTDFGFNPNWLRAAFALPLIYSPGWTVGAYLAMALIVAISRFAFPARRKAAQAPMPIAAASHEEPRTVRLPEPESEPVYAQAA